MSSGFFITFEGPDGSGKSTQIKLLKKYFEDKNCPALFTREPGGTPIGEKIRSIILDKTHTEMNAMTEALLYAASRAQHVAEVIEPALDAGKIVVCDRFIDSSIAYQGYGRRMGDCVSAINEYAVMGRMPDITFLLKLDPGMCRERIKSEEQDRLELEALHFHNEVFKGYQAIARKYPERIIGIDANKSAGEISRDIIEQLEKRIK